ncbi:MAG: DNA polymerase III subunit delta' [Gammaproteobacteria bacterium]
MSDLFADSLVPGSGKPDQAPFPWQLQHWQALLQKHSDKQLAHAYLISGEAGLGKHQFALAFARLLLCLEPISGRACGQCPNCLTGGDDFHPDILEIRSEQDGRDIQVDQVRELAAFLRQTSHSGRSKIVLLHDAHDMNTAASNALLKTLEEPSAKSLLLLVTHMPGSLMATIRSRCQRIVMHPPTWPQGRAWLAELGHKLLLDLPDSELHKLWQEAGARPLHLLAMLAQDYLSQRQEFESVLCQLAAGRLSLLDAVNKLARQGEGVVLAHLQHLSTILIKHFSSGDWPADSSKEMQQLAQALPSDKMALQGLLDFYQQVVVAQRQLAGSSNPNPRLLLEALMQQWSRLPRASRA